MPTTCANLAGTACRPLSAGQGGEGLERCRAYADKGDGGDGVLHSIVSVLTGGQAGEVSGWRAGLQGEHVHRALVARNRQPVGLVALAEGQAVYPRRVCPPPQFLQVAWPHS